MKSPQCSHVAPNRRARFVQGKKQMETRIRMGQRFQCSRSLYMLYFHVEQTLGLLSFPQ